LAWLPSWREAETVNRERINRRVLLQQLHNLPTSLNTVRPDTRVHHNLHRWVSLTSKRC
jgi:hypothetical protein